jgi:cobalt transporter subunit CbtB
MISSVVSGVTPIAAITQRILPAVLAILFGALLIYGVGFAAPAAIHNAAHDVRHAFSFPCH